MNHFEKSLAELKSYLASTSESERDLIWQEIAEIKIQGPTLSEYLESINSEMTKFNESFSNWEFCDDLTYQDFFRASIEEIEMSSNFSIQFPSVPNFSGIASVAMVDNFYAQAA